MKLFPPGPKIQLNGHPGVSRSRPRTYAHGQGCGLWENAVVVDPKLGPTIYSFRLSSLAQAPGTILHKVIKHHPRLVHTPSGQHRSPTLPHTPFALVPQLGSFSHNSPPSTCPGTLDTNQPPARKLFTHYYTWLRRSHTNILRPKDLPTLTLLSLEALHPHKAPQLRSRAYTQLSSPENTSANQ